ncbi:3'(2'),5'-bisphosphate nucleotidase CysQ [Dokdonia sp. Hel_I_53]|uniref:3'(2'),5'-bisphosphate nucleotidase CysQ n=1 Tax=Dokdonia sp. Hel_I_53 TaxID=1566287 RepID=UPI00119AD264|nr:3'(2'),5'-bisphosphate nucleotidase CysQ [Dokdonia sp. Hel_I_53]TVZ51332.1 3'(2'),5'-bisphosphate nucleotidase [Dokdonia sp. Hel_I_53]
MIENYWKDFAVKAAIKAGQAILDFYSDGFSVSQKIDTSPVTEADVTAHQIIEKILSKTNIPILSEEGKSISYKERKDWNQFWMIDPLDGTKEFINHNGEFTVNIALISKKKPVFGVIFVPVTNSIYVGGNSINDSFKLENCNLKTSFEDVFESGYSLSQKRIMNLKNRPRTILISRSHLNDMTLSYLEERKSSLSVLKLKKMGSSLKFCVIAEGLADEYTRFSPCMEWDTAAGDAICQGVNITILQHGKEKPLCYNKESLVNPNFEVLL